MNNKQITQTLIKMAQRRAKAGSGSQVKIGCTKNREFLQFIKPIKKPLKNGELKLFPYPT
jgi:hypothetical protein